MLRENFAAIVSHELKSPLGAVQQNLYTLIDEVSEHITEDQLRRLERMKTRISDLINLIKTWLTPYFTTDPFFFNINDVLQVTHLIFLTRESANILACKFACFSNPYTPFMVCFLPVTRHYLQLIIS